MLSKLSDISFTDLKGPQIEDAGVTCHVARLDKLHPVVSGNKLFKLHYFIEEAEKQSIKEVVTFGGAYSNHLVATAYACKASGLHSIGYVRGEEAAHISHTLQECRAYGMELSIPQPGILSCIYPFNR